MNDIPKPPGDLFLGALRERLRLGPEFYGEMARQHGDVANFRLATWRFVLLSHPDAIQHVLQVNPKAYSKGDLFASIKTLLGDGLFFSEGPAWRTQRRMVQPCFRSARVTDLLPVMLACVNDILPVFEAAADRGESLDLFEVMNALTLDITCRTLFGAALSVEERDRVGALREEMSHLIDKRMFSLLADVPLWVPLPIHRRMRAVIQALDAIVLGLIETRMRAPLDEAPDILTALLDARHPDTNAPLTAVELRDQVMTFFMAGHETTATALSWSLMLLAQHPDWAERVGQEADEHGVNATPQGLKNLDAAGRVFQESLRLYPPGWTFTRQSLQDDEVMGYHLPAGTNLIIAPYALHRDARFWPDPLRFDPDRFPLSKEQRTAYLPFGAGPRACIGGQFSTYEGVLALGVLMQKYRLTLVDTNIQPAPLVTLRPDPGVPVTVKRR
jgi:cytochrome P450